MNDDDGCDITIFTEAIKLPIQERASFLDKMCAGDDESPVVGVVVVFPVGRGVESSPLTARTTSHTTATPAIRAITATTMPILRLRARMARRRACWRSHFCRAN